MITRITKENRAKYVKLFSDATEALRASDIFVEGDLISDLETYFNNIEQLFELDPKFIRLPLDEDAFYIDLNTRQISIPDSFKKSGLGVQGDDMAETIYFKCDRFFDMTDLNETFIVIQWEAPNGNKMASPAYFQDVDSETDKLIFGWAITNSMTSKPGGLKFSVIFIDKQNKKITDNELNIKDLEYRLGTLTQTINVQAGLNVDTSGVINFEDRETMLRNRIKNTPILGGIYEEESDLATILNYNGFDWKKDKTFDNIETDLVNDPETDTHETGLTLLAVSPKAGLISYEWWKKGEDGKDDELKRQGPGAVKYFPVKYSNLPKANEAIYFIKEGEENYRYFDEGKDSWYDENGNINSLLYERIAFYEVEEPGIYYAKITHKEGKKKPRVLNTIDSATNGGFVGYATIPAPTAIEKVEVLSTKDIFEEGLEIFSNVEFAIENPYAKLSYQWFKKTADGDVVIENATGSTFNVAETGEYFVKVINDWNKASVEKVSDNTVKLYEAAIKPSNVVFTSPDWLNETERVSERVELSVSFDEITQQEAKQYVIWEVDYNALDDFEEWVTLDVEGLKYTPTEAGKYRVTVVNKITDKNFETVTPEAIRVI